MYPSFLTYPLSFSYLYARALLLLLLLLHMVDPSFSRVRYIDDCLRTLLKKFSFLCLHCWTTFFFLSIMSRGFTCAYFLRFGFLLGQINFLLWVFCTAAAQTHVPQYVFDAVFFTRKLHQRMCFKLPFVFFRFTDYFIQEVLLRPDDRIVHRSNSPWSLLSFLSR